MSMIPPPPYVPPEYAKRTMAEMPEPYKSDVTKWLNASIEIAGRNAKTCRFIASIYLALMVGFVMAIAVALCVVALR